ncbi:Rnf electron transport complex subunit RnfC [Methanolobus halotolerans]|uniref:Ion-translocating oxidoreductase complex subunit C n=1 Tax=Methanolobus halotolerans TaxID=2052935 RepID=A0A4E0Q6U2_9EURY|nr:Rnf electron transport complex subunit RnfC [Methanolobus halotolerans]TGC09853.1 NADH:ubiquinone oxidoreductase [Methanolobus halotolerans]
MESKRLKKIPQKVIIPLKQHLGTICEPLVKKGDQVLIGQKIGRSVSYYSSDVHSSVCGEVLAIENAPHPNGNKVLSVIIQTTESMETVDFVPTENTSQEKLISLMQEAGIVEHYGAPTHTVLMPEDKKIDIVLINSTASEWIGGKYKTPKEYASQMMDALKLLMKAAGASKGAIIVRKDDKESIEAFEDVEVNGKALKVAPLVGKRRLGYYFRDQDSNIIVASQKRIYGKKILNFFTYNVTGRKVGIGCDPTDVGVAVCSIKSAKALYDAVYEGRPYYETVITVEGTVDCPEYMLIRIGTPFKDIIESCNSEGEVAKIVANGVITGVAQYTDEVPVTKGTTRITLLTKEEVLRDESLACIHCARCVDICPVSLVPSRLTVLADQGRFDECRQMHIENCIECGRCAVVCPSKIHVLQLIRYAKNAIEGAYADAAPKESSNLKLGCCGGE